MSTLENHPFLAPTFWSYSLADLHSVTHKQLIIKQILNHGDTKALIWLKATYTKSDIQDTIKNSLVTEWSKKSLTLWSKLYEVTPLKYNRFA